VITTGGTRSDDIRGRQDIPHPGDQQPPAWQDWSGMAVQACLNGRRTRSEHPAVPLTPSELAADARAVRVAGAFAVHVHPRDSRGAETLDEAPCDAAVAAIRGEAPRLPVGLSTAETIDRDPFARAAAVRTWRRQPDFVSVNVSELGWAGLMRAAFHAGIGVEAGLSTPADAQELVRSPFVHQVVRALVEVDGGAAEARAVAQLIPDGIPQLWHGYGEQTWEVIAAGAAAGKDVRVGLEDVLVLPDGRVAANNADLVAAAVELGRHGPTPEDA
jgi:uncharacterized protein (DUF849 family)